MGDFLLDFRAPEVRSAAAAKAAASLAFTPETKTQAFDRGVFSLLLARVDGFDIWGPAEADTPGGRIFAAVAGRIALDEAEWDAARRSPGTGGLAGKAIVAAYEARGLKGLGELNGNFVGFVHDERNRQLHVVTDRCGMFMAYGQRAFKDAPVLGSHPDVLAAATDRSHEWDLTSLAEFLMTSRVSFPWTYYRNIAALEPGCVFTFDLSAASISHPVSRPYFEFKFAIDPAVAEEPLAEEFAAAFKRAVRRRSLPMFGRTGVGLSGGLDSRAILSAVDPRSRVIGFTLYDAENAEFRTAQAIAAACRTEFMPVQRDFEFYGRSAELGVRVSGGAGCISCNHFLSAWDQLRRAGIENLLTGCYCDYMFKALAVNSRENRLSCNQELNGFSFEFYDRFHQLKTRYREDVMDRLRTRFPESNETLLSDEQWLEVERKRTFPLAYEQDLAQRVIPQRVMPWYVPIVDNGLVDLYLRMPARYKLNSSIFKKMLRLLCPPAVIAVADSNTNAAINASRPAYVLSRYWTSLRGRIEEKLFSRLATAGSWPNWTHYLKHSQVLGPMWNRPNPEAREVFVSIMGEDPLARSPGQYAAAEPVLFQRLLTQKLWLDQRT